VDIPGFLRGYPPFDTLTAEEMTALVHALEIAHVPAGTTILKQGGDPAEHLFVIRKGAVELLDDARVLDLLGEGEVFGQFSLLAHAGPSVTVRAHEDTLVYLIPSQVADAILTSTSGRSFVIGTMRRRIRSAADATPDTGPDPAMVALGSLVRRPPVTAHQDMAIADAAALMAAERVSCLLVPMRGGWGIVTDRDLRSRVVAARGDLEAPLEGVVSFPAMTLDAATPAGEAFLRMFADGVHHFPVTGPDGAVIGVVTDTDLMALSRYTPSAIKGGIERALGPEAVAGAGRELPHVVAAMVGASADPVDVGRVVAVVVDAMTRRLLQIGIDRQGDPPCAWAWLALGSAARHEQALTTDQDHALAYEPGCEDPQAADAYFATLAETVTAGLEAAGIPRCSGDAMAVHPAMRKPLDAWEDDFRDWIGSPDPGSSVLASIGFDLRQVAGPLDAGPTLEGMMRTARTHPGFVRHLGRRALDLRPPTGFFHDLVVDHVGDHAGALDVKHGGISIVTNIARAYAAQAGVAAGGTLARLEAAVSDGRLEPGPASELSEAFHFLWEVRLEHQATQVRTGVDPDDYVDPGTLGPFSRSGLKEAFRVIARAQRQLAAELGIALR
jgi:CBS domain-containing protein